MKWKMHHGVRNEDKRIPRKIEHDTRRFSEASWCTRETISHLEKGKYNPSLQLAHDIAKALHSTIDEIFIFEDK